VVGPLQDLPALMMKFLLDASKKMKRCVMNLLECTKLNGR